MNQCPNCGGELFGDGYRCPVHCMDVDIDVWWDAAPDEGPFYCKPEAEEAGGDE